MTPYRARPADGVALVTGASSGIGAEMARRLAAKGFRVVAMARRSDELERLAAGNPGVVPMTGDVTDRDAMERAVAEIERDHGPIALALLNAGAYFADQDEDVGDSFYRTFEVNLLGTAHVLGPLTRLMKSRGRGQIAITASVAGYGGLPRAAAYSSSKAALIALCESLKFTLDGAGVTIQVICPGFVKTPLTDKNDFPMPFLISVEDAGERMMRGLESGGFEIAFPRRMSWMLKALNLLPYAAYFPLVARGTGR